MVLVDNDVIFKLCAYGRHRFLIDGDSWAPAFMLPVAKFVLRDLAQKSRRVQNRSAVKEAVECAITCCKIVHPSDAALTLAAELEEAANISALELDPGESQLLAVLILEEAQMLLTGDKRAVAAIEALNRAETHGKIGCLEQIMLTLIEAEDVSSLRTSVCAEAGMDKATTSCFACYAEDARVDEVAAGLSSYLNDLTRIAPNAIYPHKTLKPVHPDT